MVRIEFDSPEYWDFAAKNPKLAAFLALGPNVKFVFANKIHDIYSRNPVP